MNDELVTAAEFGDHTQAVVARMHLEEAGIPAFLSDEWMSPGLFVIGSAVGGVKLQVPKSRLEEAVRLIDERRGDQEAPLDWSEVDVGEPEHHEEPPDDDAFDELPPTPISPSSEPADMTLREQRANKIVRGAFMGLFVWPVFLFAIWRLIQIASSKERLRPEYQHQANIAAIIIGVPLLLLSVPCCIFPLAELARRTL